jgi:hypothetical protein
MLRITHTVRFALAFVACTASAFASDWYVDAVNGNNANNGTSPALAWKTITFAIAAVPQSGPQTIHVAPGLYDAALGETPGWQWRPQLSLVGDQGSAVTTIGGTSQAATLSLESYQSLQGGTFGRDTRIQGLTFLGGAGGISIESNWNAVSPTLSDLDIRGMTSFGIAVTTFTQFAGGSAEPLLDHVHIENCTVGMMLACGGTGPFHLTATDCDISRSSYLGIQVTGFRTGVLEFERCRIEDNGDWGIRIGGGNYGNVRTDLRHCTIAHNAAGGIWSSTGALYFSTLNRLTQCTVAYNTGVGVRMDRVGPSVGIAQLDSTIVHGNADDLALASGISGGPTASSVNYCEIGDGEYTGIQNNFQADPQFVNAAAGDFHLLATSPCIDAGNPALGLEQDCSRPDVGAYSFAHAQSLVYCTAKQNSCGSLPSIGASGSPSASAGSGYVIAAANTKALKAGLLMYSVAGRASSPFQGGTLCVAAPVKRSTPVADTSGTAGSCNGVLSIDMNAFAVGALGGNPLAALTVAGTRVDCQFWGRDTPASSLLSDALEYFVCP